MMRERGIQSCEALSFKGEERVGKGNTQGKREREREREREGEEKGRERK